MDKIKYIIIILIIYIIIRYIYILNYEQFTSPSSSIQIYNPKYSSSTIYTSGNIVSYTDNNIYYYVGPNQSPPPSNNWQLIGSLSSTSLNLGNITSANIITPITISGYNNVTLLWGFDSVSNIIYIVDNYGTTRIIPNQTSSSQYVFSKKDWSLKSQLEFSTKSSIINIQSNTISGGNINGTITSKGSYSFTIYYGSDSTYTYMIDTNDNSQFYNGSVNSFTPTIWGGISSNAKSSISDPSVLPTYNTSIIPFTLLLTNTLTSTTKEAIKSTSIASTTASSIASTTASSIASTTASPTASPTASTIASTIASTTTLAPAVKPNIVAPSNILKPYINPQSTIFNGSLIKLIQPSTTPTDPTITIVISIVSGLLIFGIITIIIYRNPSMFGISNKDEIILDDIVDTEHTYYGGSFIYGE